VLCGAAFLRPHAYTGRLCPLCRTLNPHQKAQLLDLPEPDRRPWMIRVYRSRLRGEPFTEWSRMISDEDERPIFPEGLDRPPAVSLGDLEDPDR
jgi:hypothetical protein